MITCDEKYHVLLSKTAVTCDREEDHYGKHSAFYVYESEDSPLGRIVWDDGGSTQGVVSLEGRTNQECSICEINLSGVQLDKHDPEMCFSCGFWSFIIDKDYDRHLFIKGMAYAWGHESGFAGRTFKIRNLTDNSIVQKKGLWHRGKVPTPFSHTIEDTHVFEVVE